MNTVQNANCIFEGIDKEMPLELSSEEVGSFAIVNEGSKLAIAIDCDIDTEGDLTLDIYKGLTYDANSMQKDNQTESNTTINLVDGNNIIEFDCYFPAVRLDIAAAYEKIGRVRSVRYISKD